MFSWEISWVENWSFNSSLAIFINRTLVKYHENSSKQLWIIFKQFKTRYKDIFVTKKYQIFTHI